MLSKVNNRATPPGQGVVP